MTEKIIKHLSKDKKLKSIIDKVDFPKSVPNDDIYFELLESIVSQQLSTKAADTIFKRFLDLFENRYPDPEILTKESIETLRSVGLSNQKANYLKNVAEFFLSEDILQKDWSQLEDEEITSYLIQIKGVGKWTTQMILMFPLNRYDVFPVDDLGIQNAMKKLYGIDIDGKELKSHLIKIAEKWKPYRTIAGKYLWKWKDA